MLPPSGIQCRIVRMCTCLDTRCKLVSSPEHFDPEDAADTVLRNVGSHANYTELNLRILQ
jgi:hypothetical protein